MMQVETLPCVFDFAIQPSAPIYGTSWTARAVLPTKLTMT
jgi:hypothetical protein